MELRQCWQRPFDLHSRHDHGEVFLGAINTHSIFPAPALGQAWKKRQGPLWRPNTRAQLYEGRKRTKACPNGRV